MELQGNAFNIDYKAIEGDVNVRPILDTKFEEIEKFSVNWFMFSQSGVMTVEDVDQLVKFDAMNQEQRRAYFLDPSNTISEITVKLLSRVSVERILQYVLLIIEGFTKDPSDVAHFTKMVERPNYDYFSAFLALFNKDDIIISQMASRILSRFISHKSVKVPDNVLVVFAKWLKGRIDSAANEYMIDDLKACQLILRIHSVRPAFKQLGALDSLIGVLMKTSNYQIQYQALFCLWMSSYSPEIVDDLVEKKIISIMADILSDSQRVKIVRIVLALCRNVLTKNSTPKKVYSLFVHNKYIQILQLSNKRTMDDEELNQDLDYILNICLKTVQDLSTYDEYAGEVLAGRLEWSPVHKSEKFWRENAIRLCENNYELLNELIKVLRTSKDAIALSVACHDIGEFVRYYTRGKLAVDKLGGKAEIINLLGSADQTVKYQALVALQKIMVHNWDFLGKQLNVPDNTATGQSKSETSLA